MAYTLGSIEYADAYFAPANHGRSADWMSKPEAARKGALSQAQRELQAFMGRALIDPSTNDIWNGLNGSYNILQHDDWAHYEQALEILDRQPMQMTGSTQKKIGEPHEDEHRGFRISPIALQYLCLPRLKVARG